jgi:hypothetical protein
MEEATMEQNRLGPPDSSNEPLREGSTGTSGLGSSGLTSGGSLGTGSSSLGGGSMSGSLGSSSSHLGTGSAGLGSGAGEMPGQVQRVTGVVTGKVKEKVAGMVEERKSQATGGLQQMAGALREVGSTLERNGLGPASMLTDKAASQIERTAGYLQRRDFDGLVRDTRDFARQHPEIVVGTAVLAGVLLGRFLRSSAPEPPELDYPTELGYSEPPGVYEPPGGWA